MNGAVAIVNGDKYRKMIEEYLLSTVENLNMQNFWLQQYSAPQHTAKNIMAFLRAAFYGSLISRFGDVS